MSIENNKTQRKIHLQISSDSNTVLSKFVNGNLNIPMLLNIQERNSSKFIEGLTFIQKALQSTNDGDAMRHFLSHFTSNRNVFINFVSSLIGKQFVGKLKREFLEAVLKILHLLNQKLPPISSIILKVLLPQLYKICETSREKELYLPRIQELEQQKDNHQSNFRLLPTIPSNKELLSHEKSSLQPLIIKGPYKNAEEYLNIHYKLLREDLFRNFKKCLSDYHSNRNFKNGKLYSNVYLEKIEYGLSGKLWHFVVPTIKAIHWNTTKRLNSGYLVCISCDGFKTFQFGSIYSRSDNGDIGKICSLALLFDKNEEPKDFSHFFEIIDTGAFYESYRYTFENLKQLNVQKFPFGKSLIDFRHCDERPFKLNEEQERMIENFKQEINDENQSAAFELALRNMISLIQGPPGTGKSYLASQIARFIIEVVNQQSHHLVDCETSHRQGNNHKDVEHELHKLPLILLCYTNHALDQFLEKMLNYTKKIIRIGERSKNDVLKAHNLRYLKNSVYSLWKDRVSEKEKPIVKEAKCIASIMKCKNSSYRKSNGEYAKLKVTSMDLNLKSYSCAGKIAYPFKNETMDVTLHDIYFLDEIDIPHKIRNIFPDFKDSSKLIKIYKWLMVDVSSSEMYDEIIDFKDILVEELTLFFELKENDFKKSAENHNSKETKKIEPLAELLIALCIHNNMSRKLFKIKLFVQKYLYKNEDVFPLFLRSAVRCSNRNKVVIPNDCKDLWDLELIERWMLLDILLEPVLMKIIQTFEVCENRKTFDTAVENFNNFSDEENIKDILQYADIIGMTITGAAKNFNMLQKLNPTTYIVEEAAEVLESQIVAALLPNIKHLIMIGDHFQLRPSSIVRDLSVKYNLNISLFERLFKNGGPSKCLEVQHRMRPLIANLLVPGFYSSLKNHSSVLEYENVAGVCTNVFFLQHSEIEDGEHEIKSYSNSLEAEFVTNFCEYLINQGHEPSSITILTTYIGQLHLIKKCMQYKNLKDTPATTVDSYQGEENDIILLSFVRSNVDSRLGFIKTDNRICVALSRARKGLYCIGNFKMFASKSKTWDSLIKKLEKRNKFGYGLSLRCHKHPKPTFLIKSNTDLRNHIKRGCELLCNEKLPCLHTCHSVCHVPNTQHKKCEVLCNEKLPCLHTCDLVCHIPNTQHKSHLCNIKKCLRNTEEMTKDVVKGDKNNDVELIVINEFILLDHETTNQNVHSENKKEKNKTTASNIQKKRKYFQTSTPNTRENDHKTLVKKARQY